MTVVTSNDSLEDIIAAIEQDFMWSVESSWREGNLWYTAYCIRRYVGTGDTVQTALVGARDFAMEHIQEWRPRRRGGPDPEPSWELVRTTFGDPTRGSARDEMTIIDVFLEQAEALGRRDELNEARRDSLHEYGVRPHVEFLP